MFPVSAAWCRTHFFTAEQCQETCYGLWADSLISGRWRFPNWQFFGSEPISGGVRTAWSRWHLDEIINCGRMAQLISHSLSVASLPYATLTFMAILRSRNNRRQSKYQGRNNYGYTTENIRWDIMSHLIFGDFWASPHTQHPPSDSSIIKTTETRSKYQLAHYVPVDICRRKKLSGARFPRTW